MAYNGKLVSIGEILWKVLNMPICSELSLEQASEFALEVLRLIGAPLSFIDKVEKIDFDDYKLTLPSDLIEVRGVRCDGTPLRYATDLYHLSLKDNQYPCDREYTYILQNCVMTTSIEKGCIEISYKAIATDENGYPMIPDNESYSKAIQYHIISMYLEPLWAMGKITDKVFSYYKQERDWYIGQASSALTIPNMDFLASMMQGINRLIINNSAYQTFYKNYGIKERIKKHY